MFDALTWDYAWWVYVLGFLGGYLLGSIPFSYMVTKAFGLGDIRKLGSGNVGATNVLRTGNKKAAALALAGDMGKGLAAVLIAQQFGDAMTLLAVFGAFLGHVFPVWLNFQGGKGVATYAGMMLGLNWMAFLAAAVIWGGTVALTRISSAGALAAAVLVPLLLWALGSPVYAALAAALSVLVFITHRSNIARLLKGEEPRIGASRKAGA